MVVKPLACRSHHSAICQLIRSHSKIGWIWSTGFKIDKCATVRSVVLRQAIFKRKKGFATISLGLIYHSMVLSQPPSHDTVPLSLRRKISHIFCLNVPFDVCLEMFLQLTFKTRNSSGWLIPPSL
jgi:hypothetical protein